MTATKRLHRDSSTSAREAVEQALDMLWQSLPDDAAAVLYDLSVSIVEEIGATNGLFVYGDYRPHTHEIRIAWRHAQHLSESLLVALLAHELAHAVLYAYPETRRHWQDEEATDRLAATFGDDVEGLRRFTGPKP